MSSDQVSDDFDDELLSAYVDGELNAEERAAVEARLKSDPRAARLVRELRSLSKAIKALPREALGEDLRLRVQAEIEEARSAAAAEVLPVTPPYDRWNGIRRGLWWSAAAIAATVALVMLTPENAGQKQREIAQREDEVPQSNANATTPSAEKEVPPGLAGSMRAMDAPDSGSAPVGAAQAPAPSGPPEAVAPSEAKSGAATDERPEEGVKRTFEDQARRSAAGESGAIAVADAAKPTAGQQQGAGQTERSNMPMARSADDFNRSLQGEDDRGESTEGLPKEVELVVKHQGGVARFEELLRQQDVQLVDGPDVQSQGKAIGKQLAGQDKKFKDQKLAEEPAAEEKSAAGASHDRLTELSGGSQFGRLEGSAPPVEERIVVEASPEKIERLVTACVADVDFFAAIAGSRQEVERLGGNRPAAPVAQSRALAKPSIAGGEVGGFGGATESTHPSTLALDAAGDAAKVPEATGKDQSDARRSGGKSSGARAWRLSPAPSSGAMVDREESREVKSEASVRLRDRSSISSGSLPGGVSTSAGAPMASSQRLAKESERSSNEKVRVVFVLRRAWAPATASTPPAAGVLATPPATSSAAPTERTPAQRP